VGRPRRRMPSAHDGTESQDECLVGGEDGAAPSMPVHGTSVFPVMLIHSTTVADLIGMSRYRDEYNHARIASRLGLRFLYWRPSCSRCLLAP